MAAGGDRRHDPEKGSRFFEKRHRELMRRQRAERLSRSFRCSRQQLLRRCGLSVDHRVQNVCNVVRHRRTLKLSQQCDF
jgi:hypothetical protein